ncbi:M48 family metallopeptidase [Achromobacter sp. Marseille-Q0513]|uniref:M48 family metallopeptidase n=1 Tax=Achromobacter sp. Marseille-Q0513 TaxID=2829161 RepID=UPI001B9F2733|nr:SprT family zinc-dependent metalloprotease [Achromobacter sp. Marseille-Q0513]MBR8655300.1 M48 family metallopeptidase [Achromobacter sp. Marseille-Q0513]
MLARIALGGIEAEVIFKDIRNVHLTVLPPNGRVRISAPTHMALDTVRVFALSKLAWIKSQRQSMAEQEREPSREYMERESHYVWGRRYLLKLVETDGAPTVTLRHRTLVLAVKQGAGLAVREAVLSRWYRDQVRERASLLVERWCRTLGLDAPRLHVQHMKTKWGSCSPTRRSIRLNTELAKKPPGCLEYIVIHELVHLLEPTHNEHFKALMRTFLPEWEDRRRELNALPVRHEAWGY